MNHPNLQVRSELLLPSLQINQQTILPPPTVNHPKVTTQYLEGVAVWEAQPLFVIYADVQVNLYELNPFRDDIIFDPEPDLRYGFNSFTYSRYESLRVQS